MMHILFPMHITDNKPSVHGESFEKYPNDLWSFTGF